MRTVSAAATPGGGADPTIEATLVELTGLVREMRCAALAGLMRQDVSMGQLHVLWLMEHHGPIPMTRLAEQLGVSLPAATGLVDRMEERGLIERVGDPEDRRRVLVRPGPGGRLALEETEGLRRDRLRRILRRLDHRQLRRVELAIHDLREAVGAELGAGPVGSGSHRHYFTDDVA